MEADPAVVDAVLNRCWPDAACELYARDPWELLVAAILSARTSDQQVNRSMATLCEHLVGLDAWADLPIETLAERLRRLPLWRQKARAVVEAARAIRRHHQGRVPEDPAVLALLPGVGRKVAAVVAGNAYGVPAVAADVHVTRLAYRLGWTARSHGREAELALRERFPPQRWVRLCHQLIRLGRAHCRRQPKCASCPLAGRCPAQGVGGP